MPEFRGDCFKYALPLCNDFRADSITRKKYDFCVHSLIFLSAVVCWNSRHEKLPGVARTITKALRRRIVMDRLTIAKTQSGFAVRKPELFRAA